MHKSRPFPSLESLAGPGFPRPAFAMHATVCCCGPCLLENMADRLVLRVASRPSRSPSHLKKGSEHPHPPGKVSWDKQLDMILHTHSLSGNRLQTSLFLARGLGTLVHCTPAAWWPEQPGPETCWDLSAVVHCSVISTNSACYLQTRCSQASFTYKSPKPLGVSGPPDTCDHSLARQMF